MFHKHKRTIGVSASRAPYREFRLPPQIFSRLIEEYYTSLDSAISLKCLILFRAKEFDQLVRLELDPHLYNSSEAFSIDFAAVSFLRKAEFLNTGVDKEQVALNSFIESEEQCRLTNERFRNLAFDPLYKGSNVWLLSQLQRKIAWFLGVLNTDGQDSASSGFDIVKFFDVGGWGPGVSLSVKGEDTTASRKFTEERELTHEVHRYLLPAAKLAYSPWLGLRDDFKIVPGSKIITVPKNAKTDRTIAVEPGLNLYFQKAAGRLIRSKLRYKGYDLNKEKRSHVGAYLGSRHNKLATVDFRSASDTISTEVLRQILPTRWFTVLDLCRSHSYTLDVQPKLFEKFSSMGNGFTFELESLIFVAAALVVTELLGEDTEDIAVFGDDIVIPGSCVPLYTTFCKFLGFTVNSSKSFSSSYFRESCGAYYFKGCNVKPIFLKQKVSSLPELYDLHNKLKIATESRGYPFANLVQFIIRQIPVDLRYYGPGYLGRAVLVCNFDEMPEKQLKKAFGLEGFILAGLLDRPLTVYRDDHGRLLAALASMDSRISVKRSLKSDDGRSLPLGNDLPLRMATRLVLNKRIYVARRWCNLLQCS